MSERVGGLSRPFDRWGEAERDIGRAVVYLAGPDAEIMTGCLLSLDNGSAML